LHPTQAKLDRPRLTSPEKMGEVRQRGEGEGAQSAGDGMRRATLDSAKTKTRARNLMSRNTEVQGSESREGGFSRLNTVRY
jgi:hypothetical protein